MLWSVIVEWIQAQTKIESFQPFNRWITNIFWLLGGSETSCKHNTNVLLPYEADTVNLLANSDFFMYNSSRQGATLPFRHVFIHLMNVSLIITFF